MKNSNNHNRFTTEQSKGMDRVKSARTFDPIQSTNNSHFPQPLPWSKTTNTDIVNAINQYSK